MKMKCLRVQFIKELNKRLGLEHSCDNQEIKREILEDIQPWLFENYNYIHTIFELNSKAKPNNISYENSIKLLKKIYGNWCNSQITSLEKDRKSKTLIYKFENEYRIYDIIRNIDEFEYMPTFDEKYDELF